MATVLEDKPASAKGQPPRKHYRWWQELLRVLTWLVCHVRYRIRLVGHDHVPVSGGALLASNHMSYLDGPVLMMMTKRPVRAFVWAGNFRGRWGRAWAETWNPIFIDNGPKSILRALKTAREAIRSGELVLLFPEGGISRNAQLQTFRDGLLKIVEDLDAPVIPVFVDGVWGSILSYAGGQFLGKWPAGWRRRITIHYGEPLRGVTRAEDVRQSVLELGASAVSHRPIPYPSLPSRFVRMCKRRSRQPKLSDSPNEHTTGGDCLLRSLILRRILRREVLRPDERHVGVLLPPSVPGVLANMALALDGRVPIHLNYSVTSDVINQCIASAGIQHVLTSRRVLSKLDLKLQADVVHLEDMKGKLRLTDKIAGALAAYLCPAWLLNAWLRLDRLRGQETSTIIFTSGSTGTPKGVVLSYDNIASNVFAIEQVIRLGAGDKVMGVLPFFHSFGFTVTLWTPMTLDMFAAYHFSPLDGRRIGEMIERHKINVFLATPTFLRNYLKRCSKEQFASLEIVVAGAEKLPTSLCDTFEEKYGVRPVEGYGCTELSPLVSVNVPPSRSFTPHQLERKEGTVGRPVPHVAVKTVDLETGADLPVGQEGMLLVSGPNVMQGYWNDPEKTRAVIKDGWYVTGDLAVIDADGFIKITGRESRFAKIGGEMVPHVLVEEALAKIIGGDEEEGLKAMVTSVPDAKRGERLIVLHVKLDKTPQELCDALLAAGLPNLFIPGPEDFHQIAALPILGTGKMDLKALKQMAIEAAGG